MALSVVHAPPPNFAEALAAFPDCAKPGVMFCWGRKIFIPKPNRPDVHPSLMAHETVHADRQGNDPAGWWRRYIDDPQFRFDEELPAHQAEYRWFAGKPLAERQYMLRQIAHRLSGPLYGRMITMHTAKMLISGKAQFR